VADPADPVAIRPLEVPRRIAASLVLIRHGESTWVAEGRFQGRQDPPLSALGVRQAELVADRLAQRDERTPLPIPAGLPARIWHSPLERAAHTARIIAERQPGPVQLQPADSLSEIAQGDWEGQFATEVRTRWATELAAWRATPARFHAPGGEPLLDAYERVRAGLGELLSGLTTADGDVMPAYDPVPGYATVASSADARTEPWVVLVAHDGIFRLVLIALLGVPLERFWSFPFNLAALTVVTVHDGVAALRAHNLADHLAPLADEDRAAAEARGERRGAL
jgi:phosphoserine phosphatase